MRAEYVLRVHPGGSGYLIAPRLVLTSAHVTGPINDDKTVWVSTPLDRRRYPGTVVWSGKAGGDDDVSLVELGSEWTPPKGKAPTRWGRTATGRPSNLCEIRGLPSHIPGRRSANETAHLTGRLNPGDGWVGDYYLVRLDEDPAPRTEPGTSRWQGLSGAAVFSGDLLLGVVAKDPEPQAAANLVVVPAYVLFDNTDFRRVLATPEHAVDGIWPEPLEWQDLMDTSARAPTESDRLHPSELLLARREIVPFRGREELRDKLTAWMEGRGVAWLVHGRGGQGKTRLARQFGSEQVAQRRAMLWLDPHATEFGVIADAAATSLVIVDYAETRQAQIRKLFDALARKGDAKVKVLLLARTAGEWWDTVRSASDPIIDLLRDAQSTELSFLDGEPADRRSGYRHAIDAFSSELSRTAGSADIDWTILAERLAGAAGTRPVPETALGVDMTALADLLDAAEPVGPDKTGVAEERLWRHETRYWQNAATEEGLARNPSELDSLADALAAAILVGVATNEEADVVLGATAALEHLTQYQRRAVRNWIGRLYPPPGGAAWGELQPDRLAEWFVGRHLLTHPEVADDLAPRLTAVQAARVLTICSRAADHRGLGGDLGPLVARICVREADVLAPIAIRVATSVENPDPLLAGLTSIVADEDTTLEFLQRLDGEQPRKSLVLAPWAATLSDRLVAHYRRLVASNPDAHLRELAQELNNLAVRLCDAHQHVEAVEPSRQSVDILRGLARSDGDSARALAGALITLTAALVGSGQPTEAVAVSVAAVTLRRALPGTEPADLAEALNGQAAALYESGYAKDAVDPAEDAVAIYRRLAHDRTPAQQGLFAGALRTLAAALLEANRNEEALPSSAEAVELYKELDRTHPDAYRIELAAAWHNHAAVLESEDPEGAAHALHEAVRVYRMLYRARPGEFTVLLAEALEDYADFAKDLGWQNEAAVATAEAVALT